MNSTPASKTLAWEIRDGKFCQEFYRTNAWDCGDISIIARKGDKIRYFNPNGAIRDDGTIIDGG